MIQWRTTPGARVLIAMLLVVGVAGCAREEMRSYRGVMESAMVKLEAPVAGNLSSLSVGPGSTVTEGANLFSQAGTSEISAHAQATQRLQQAADTGDRRPDGGADEIEQLKADVAQAEWKMQMMSASAPVNGVVTATLYSKGDWVPAGAEVLTILPFDKIKVNFEVPLSVAARLQNGQAIVLSCEQCRGAIPGKITYISPFATTESAAGEADQLQYRIEARPDPAHAASLKPGQSMTVSL